VRNTEEIIAHKRPTRRLPVNPLPNTPARAAKSIVPSRPIFTIPALSTINAPMAAKRMGVVIRKMENQKSGVIKTEKKFI
jgi:hypothetical protein